MKKKLRIITSVMVMLCMLIGVLVIPRQVQAEDSEIWQVNGEYEITTTKLVTKCRLEGADSSKKEKVRTYKITSKTKIQKVNSDYSKKTIKGKKRTKIIKKLNKNNETIQFKEKNGVVQFIWYNI